MALSSVTNRSVSLPLGKNPGDGAQGPALWVAGLLKQSQHWGKLHGPLLNLSQETKAEIFFPNLEHLAHRAEQGNQRRQAGLLYEFIAAHPQASQTQRERAQARLKLYQGEGSWGERLELGAQGFLREVTHPGMLLAMGFGSTAFRAGKLFAFRGLATGSRVTWGARIGSSAVGLATESLAFTEVGRGYAWLTGVIPKI